MRPTLKIFFLALSLAAVAQTALDAPPLALLLSNGRLTPVFGVAGTFITGEPGSALLSYSFDGEIEWRLEEGRITASQANVTAVYATTEASATFRGDKAILGESGLVLQMKEGVIEELDREFFDGRADHIAHRTIGWADGKLHIIQNDGSKEEVDCPDQPSGMTAGSADWVHLTFQRPGRDALLLLSRGRAAIFRLPRRNAE